jgi:hypothetical protein
LFGTDPDGRMLAISCGAALHHARTSLTAQGYRTIVLPYPDPSHPDHLAHLSIAGRTPITAAALRLYQAIALRRTDRRPVPAERLDDNALLAITMAVQGQNCYLYPLRPDQALELASTTGHAQDEQRADDTWRAELARWAGGDRPDGTGVPDANIPDRQPQTTVPERDFGRQGTLPVGDDDHDSAATYAILYGDLDEPPGWLDAGQALSAAWLTATEFGVSLLPVSAPVEVPSTRQALRGPLSGIGYPYLVIRLGMADELRGPAATPRLSPDRTVVAEDE